MLLFNGDSELELKKVKDETVDLVLTSPPYDNLRSYNNPEAFTMTKFKKILLETKRVLKPGGTMIIVIGDATLKGSETGTSFEMAMYIKEELGFCLHDTMVYEKNASSFPARISGNRYSQIFEYMFVFSKDDSPKFAKLMCDKPNKWKGWKNWGKNSHRGKNDVLVKTKDIKPVAEFSPRNNIWKYNVGCKQGTKDTKTYKHPASFPENLAIDHILSWSEEGDVVLDPFMGSGTTGVACKKFRRKFIGIELDKEYYELSKERIEETETTDETFETWETKLKEEKRKQAITDIIKLASTSLNLENKKDIEEAVKKVLDNKDKITEIVYSLVTDKRHNPSIIEKKEEKTNTLF